MSTSLNMATGKSLEPSMVTSPALPLPLTLPLPARVRVRVRC